MSNPTKQVFTTPNPFEKRFGYHRAVRRGPFIFVAGTTAIKVREPVPAATQHSDVRVSKTEEADGRPAPQDEAMIHCPDDAYGQTIITLRRCVDAVKALGGSLGDITRIRLYVPRPQDCSAVCEGFKDVFGTDRAQLEGVPGMTVGFPTDEYIDEEHRHRGVVRSLPAETPAAVATMVIVPHGFVDETILIEVEADAIVL